MHIKFGAIYLVVLSGKLAGSGGSPAEEKSFSIPVSHQ